MKTRFLMTLVLASFVFGEIQELSKESPLLEQTIQENEETKRYSVPRETVPVEEIKYLIDTPIPKTAHYLPLLQPLLNIKVGSLPNPLGIGIIGSYTDEKYTITRFSGTLGNVGNIATQLQPLIARDKQKIIDAINQSFKGIQGLIIGAPLKLLVNKIAQNDPKTMAWIQNLINNTTGAGQSKEWQISNGKVRTKTAAVGLKADIWILPFMNLFATAAYLNVQQNTDIGTATIGLSKPIANISSLPVPVGILSNQLDGYVVMGGTNLAIGYKGFFASFMVSSGYVQLNDSKNNIKGFVEKPFIYYGPRIGYSYNGIFTIHTGVQRIELLGPTEGKDLSKLTGGLVSNYSVEIKKFPVNFLAGVQFMFMRDLGLSVEYVGSPDTNGLNAELAFRF